MRMLLMISNSNMSLRELYTMVLDSHPDGWITSFMSGMPGDAEAIVGGYGAVIFELGAADKEDRVAAVTRLRDAGMPVITHLEGRAARQFTDQLAAAGVIVIPSPVTASRVQEALDQLSQRLRKQRQGGRRLGVRGFFRRLLAGT